MKLRLKNTFSQCLFFILLFIETFSQYPFFFFFFFELTFSQYLSKHIQQKIQVNEYKFSESYETI